MMALSATDMHDLAFITAAYVALIIGCMGLGYATRWGIDLWKARRASRMSAARISFDDAFPIIDGWARRPGNEWYWDCRDARHFAEDEFGRLVRDEPGLTVNQTLSRVTNAVKQKYPEAFQTLH
jgi:hypothetical protein